MKYLFKTAITSSLVGIAFAFAASAQTTRKSVKSVSFTPKKTSEFGSTCGMNMMHDKIMVR